MDGLFLGLRDSLGGYRKSVFNPFNRDEIDGRGVREFMDALFARCAFASA